MRSSFLLLALAALAGCDPATTGAYRGEPLAVLRGRLVASDALQLQGPVKLAVVWNPSPPTDPLTGPVASPSGVDVTEVAYTGTFPQDFSFELYGPPRAEQVFDGLNARWGALVAYEDLDGDGRLTIAGPGQLPRDRLVGASMLAQAMVGQQPWDGFLLAYVQQAAGRLPSGFSLMSFTADGASTVQPLDAAGTARVTLRLDGNPLQRLWACDDFFSTARDDPREVCGLTVRTAPRIYAGLSMGGTNRAEVRVREGRQHSAAALVDVDGVRLPVVDSGGVPLYLASGPEASMLHPGSNPVRVVLPPFAATELEVTIPEQPVVSGASDGAVVDAGTVLDLAWEPVVGATAETLSVFVELQGYDTYNFRQDFTAGGQRRRVPVTLPPGARTASVAVSARWVLPGAGQGENAAWLGLTVSP